MDFPERDWKHLREVKRAALERYCERVLQECASIISDRARTAHERYLAVHELMRERDDDLSSAFHDHRRSTALLRLLSMRSLGMVTDEEMKGFSRETRERVDAALRNLR